MNQVELAEQIAREAHEGQFRRDGVTPYIEHPKAVAEMLEKNFPYASETVAAAWLHDVVEDSELTLAELANRGVNESVIRMVDLLTKRKGDTYHTFMCRVI